MGSCIWKTGYALGLLMVMVSSLWATTAQDDYQAGVLFYGQGQYGEAITILQESVKENPNFWQAYQVLGQAYYKSGNKTAALSAFNKSLKINPNNPDLRRLADSITRQDKNISMPNADSIQTKTAESEKASNEGIYLDLGLGIDPLSNYSGTYYASSDLNVGYSFNEKFSVRLEFGASTYENHYGNWAVYKFLPELKYFFASAEPSLKNEYDTISPYLLIGIGAEITAFDTTSETLTNPDAILGLGTEINVGNAFLFYLEAKSNFEFSSGSTSTDFPIIAGFHINL